MVPRASVAKRYWTAAFTAAAHRDEGNVQPLGDLGSDCRSDDFDFDAGLGAGYGLIEIAGANFGKLTALFLRFKNFEDSDFRHESPLPC